MTDLILRPLEAADVSCCAQLHLTAFPGFFLSELGPRFLREFYRGFVGDEEAITVASFTADGALAGVVVGTIAPSGYFRRLLKRRFLGFASASLVAVVRRPSSVLRLLKAARYRGQVPLKVDGALLSSICVDPRTQAHGVGTQLISQFEKLVHGRGLGAYLVTDRDNNDSVNSFYRRNGWVLTGTYETPEGRSMNCYVLRGP